MLQSGGGDCWGVSDTERPTNPILFSVKTLLKGVFFELREKQGRQTEFQRDLKKKRKAYYHEADDTW